MVKNILSRKLKTYMNCLNLMSFEMFFVSLNLTFYKTTEEKFEDDIQMKKRVNIDEK